MLALWFQLQHGPRKNCAVVLAQASKSTRLEFPGPQYCSLRNGLAFTSHSNLRHRERLPAEVFLQPPVLVENLAQNLKVLILVNSEVMWMKPEMVNITFASAPSHFRNDSLQSQR